MTFKRSFIPMLYWHRTQWVVELTRHMGDEGWRWWWVTSCGYSATVKAWLALAASELQEKHEFCDP